MTLRLGIVVSISVFGIVGFSIIPASRTPTILPEVNVPELTHGYKPLRFPQPPAEGRTPGRPSMVGPGWHVTRFQSITDILIVTVETDNLDDMLTIARDVVTPTENEHLEALVYFRRSGKAMAVGRVRWTPHDGYSLTMFSE